MGPYLHIRCNVSSMKYVTCFGVSNEKTTYFIEEENTLIKIKKLMDVIRSKIAQSDADYGFSAF